MEKIPLTQDQYERLLGSGTVHFYDHTIYSIHWQTYFAKIAMFQDARDGEKRLVEITIKE